MFAVVSLDSDTLGLLIVRVQWFLKNKPDHIFFPIKSKEPVALVKKMPTPDYRWPVHKVAKIYATNLDTYDEAFAAQQKLCKTSESSGVESLLSTAEPRKRKIKKPKKLLSDEEEVPKKPKKCAGSQKKKIEQNQFPLKEKHINVMQPPTLPKFPSLTKSVVPPRPHFNDDDAISLVAPLLDDLFCSTQVPLVSPVRNQPKITEDEESDESDSSDESDKTDAEDTFFEGFESDLDENLEPVGVENFNEGQGVPNDLHTFLEPFENSQYVPVEEASKYPGLTKEEVGACLGMNAQQLMMSILGKINLMQAEQKKQRKEIEYIKESIKSWGTSFGNNPLENEKDLLLQSELFTSTFPLNSMEAVEAMEKKLKEDKEFAKKIFKALKTVGGDCAVSTTNNMLNKIFSNTCAQGFSFKGQGKDTKPLKKLYLMVMVKFITRLNYPTVSDESFKKTVTNWKKNTRQRIKTQAKLDAKEAENVADADDLGFLIE